MGAPGQKGFGAFSFYSFPVAMPFAFPVEGLEGMYQEDTLPQNCREQNEQRVIYSI
jgi:hypothetical protein